MKNLFLSSPAPSPYLRLRWVVPCVLLVVISISFTFFYWNVVSLSSNNVSLVPYTLAIPPGNCNCNCTVIHAPNAANPSESTPSLYCQCLEKSGIGSNVTLACPKLEPQIVQKEVIKEVEKACPKVEPQIIEKEVIKEVEKDCPKVEPQIIEKEVIKEVEKDCPKVEPQIIEKEVIKEVEKECPKVEPEVVEKEVIKECPKMEPQVIEKEVVKEVEKECPPVPSYVLNRTWHYPASFPLCSMDVCFNYSRCSDAEELLIYTYYNPIPPPRYFSNIKDTKYHTNDPSKACLFLVPFDAAEPGDHQDIRKLPYWNGGLNHLVLTFSDKYARVAPSGDALGYASIVASDLQETMYRPGFDISIPFPGNFHLRQFQSVSPLDRKYFATFRGLRYLGYTDDGIFRSAKEFRSMHNGHDVIVATTCEHPTNNYKRTEHPELGEGCDEDREVHAKYDFVDLMNSTFALVPAGRQPASYRFTEALSAGAIPVLIADNYVKPFDSIIPWYTCLLQFPTTEMHRIVKTLRSMPDEEKLKRQRNCLQIYENYLKDNETLLRSTIRSLKARFLGAFPNLSEIGNKRRRSL